MAGRRRFSPNEASEIRNLLARKSRADRSAQKHLRNRIRKIGFYITDFDQSGLGFGPDDFDRLVSRGTVVVEQQDTPTHSVVASRHQPRNRHGSDESYVIDLCDEVLGERSERQYHFDFLRGDSRPGGRGRMLPVDAFYPELKLAVEYHERQHTQQVAFFDKPDKLTVSGVHRGEQRRRYDERRRQVLPTYGIRLVEISYDELAHSLDRRLSRDRCADLPTIRRILGHTDP